MKFVHESFIAAPPSRVFAFHERKDALQLLTPPFAPARVVTLPPSLLPGSRAVLKVRVGPVWVTWVAEHTRYEQGVLFEDTQVSGPFRRWVHTHRMVPSGDGTLLRDELDLALPLAPLSWLAWPLVKLQLGRLFRFRHEVTAKACAMPVGDLG